MSASGAVSDEQRSRQRATAAGTGAGPDCPLNAHPPITFGARKAIKKRARAHDLMIGTFEGGKARKNTGIRKPFMKPLQAVGIAERFTTFGYGRSLNTLGMAIGPGEIVRRTMGHAGPTPALTERYMNPDTTW